MKHTVQSGIVNWQNYHTNIAFIRIRIYCKRLASLNEYLNTVVNLELIQCYCVYMISLFFSFLAHGYNLNSSCILNIYKIPPGHLGFPYLHEKIFKQA